MGESIITIGEIPTPDDRRTWIRSRVLEILARGIPRDPGDDRGDGWWHRPGALPWWEVRTRIGGRVAAAAFAAAVEGMIADGLVIEAWLAARGRQVPSHVLMLPGHSRTLKSPVVRARGHASVLAEEPWAEGLGRPARPDLPRAADPGPVGDDPTAR